MIKTTIKKSLIVFGLILLGSVLIVVLQILLKDSDLSKVLSFFIAVVCVGLCMNIINK